jgi:hypothetical protein
MSKNKINNYLIIGILILCVVIYYFGYVGFFSVVDGSWDTKTVSSSGSTSDGVYLSLLAISNGGTGYVQSSFSGSRVFSGSMAGNDIFRSASLPGINNQFPLNLAEYRVEDIYISYMMWARTNPSSGDWSKDVGGSSDKGYALCKALNIQGNPDGNYNVGLLCDFYFNITCPYAECELRDVYSIKANEVFIPYIDMKINYYRLVDNECKLVNIKESEKTPDDYLNMEDCQKNIVSCLTKSDVNCDGSISRDEFGKYLIKWVYGQVSRSDLSSVISAWANQ